MHGANPCVALGVLVNHDAGVVRRAVVHNYPFGGENRLAQHTLESVAEVSFFIPDRSNDDVLGIEDTHFNS